MAPPRCWPSTDAERRDRARVEELVTRVGRSRLRWTVDDLTRETTRAPHLALEHPRQLERHLRALVPCQAVRVEGRLDTVLDRRRDASGTVGARRRAYVLRSRLDTYALGVVDALDDLERVVVALAVARLALRAAAVPTDAVTAVLGRVPELALVRPAQTNVLLGQLAAVSPPVVAQTRQGRWARWDLVEPLRPAWDARARQWAREVAPALAARADAAAVGATTASEIATRLLTLAIADAASPMWPQGHPRTAREVRAYAEWQRQHYGAEREATRLLNALERLGTTVADALRDASRPGTDGRPRPATGVVRFEPPAGEQPAYDVAARPGAADGALWAAWRRCEKHLTFRALSPARSDLRTGEDLIGGDDGTPAWAALVAVRRALVAAEVHALADAVADVARHAARVSDALAKLTTERLERIRELAGRAGDAEALGRAAAARCQAAGSAWAPVRATPRPVLAADAFVRLLPLSYQFDRDPASVVACATTVRARPLASTTDGGTDTATGAGKDARTRVGRGRQARQGVDRPDAVLYAAEVSSAPALAFLRDGGRLLGSYLGCPTPIAPLLRSPLCAVRRQALGALALLGARKPVGAHLRALLRAPAAADEGELLDAIAAALLVGLVPDVRWPDADDLPTHRLVAAVRGVQTAAARGDVFLPR